jgi:hypothetical protein
MWYVIIDLSKIKKQSEVFIMKTNEKRAFKALAKESKKNGGNVFTWDLEDRMLISDGCAIYVVGKAVFETHKEECFKGIKLTENEALLKCVEETITVDDTIDKAYATAIVIDDDMHKIKQRVYKFKDDIVPFNQTYIDIAMDLGYPTAMLRGRKTVSVFCNLLCREVLQGWFVLPLTNYLVKEHLRNIKNALED